MTPEHDEGAGDPAPFVLPGPPPTRETLAGWQQWRAARDSFTPAPRLGPGRLAGTAARRRMLYDLHRAATHANLPLQQTPMSQAVTRVLRGRIESNALKHKPSTRAGVMITGGGYQGKTETACEVAGGFEDAWLELHDHLNPDALAGTRDLHAPVAYAQTPVTAKPKSTCKAILGFYGADTKNMDLPDLVRQAAASISDHGTKALLLDDITRLRMHRADDQDVLDLIRAFMSMHVTLVPHRGGHPRLRAAARGPPRPAHRAVALPAAPARQRPPAGGHPDRAALRPDRAGPVPLRHPRRDRRLDPAPGRRSRTSCG